MVFCKLDVRFILLIIFFSQVIYLVSDYICIRTLLQVGVVNLKEMCWYFFQEGHLPIRVNRYRAV